MNPPSSANTVPQFGEFWVSSEMIFGGQMKSDKFCQNPPSAQTIVVAARLDNACTSARNLTFSVTQIYFKECA